MPSDEVYVFGMLADLTDPAGDRSELPPEAHMGFSWLAERDETIEWISGFAPTDRFKVALYGSEVSKDEHHK